MSASAPDFLYDVPDWARDRTSKRAITFHLRASREYASGAVALLRDGEDDTAKIAIEMAQEGLDEAERLLLHRTEGTAPA